MKESGINLRGQFTVYRGNVGIVPDIYDEVSNLNVDLNLSLFRHQNKEQMSQNRAEDLIPYLEKYFARVISRIDKGEYYGNKSSFDYMNLGSVRNRVCGTGSNYIVIDSNGDIYTCHESIKFCKPLSNCFTKNNIFDDIKRGFSLNGHVRNNEIIGNSMFEKQGGIWCVRQRLVHINIAVQILKKFMTM